MAPLTHPLQASRPLPPIPCPVHAPPPLTLLQPVPELGAYLDCAPAMEAGPPGPVPPEHSGDAHLPGAPSETELA